MGIGVVVLDTNAIKAFEDPAQRERMFRSLRSADLALRISAINVLEILKTENPRVRERLIKTAGALCAGSYIIPGPTVLLKAAGEALLAGSLEFQAPESGLDWILREPERITEEHLAAARKHLIDQETMWNEAHTAGRAVIREVVRKNHGKDPWGSVAAFLDGQWTKRDQLDTFIAAIWRQCGLPGDPPIDLLLAHEIWRTYLEAQGALIYERAVAAQTTKPAQIADVYQLVYLTGADRRILVTDDGPFTRVATQVLDRRFPGSRILTPTAFLEGAG